MVCCDQEFVKEVNKIIFDFIWKGKDKVKPGSDAVLHMSRIEFQFRPAQIINPG